MRTTLITCVTVLLVIAGFAFFIPHANKTEEVGPAPVTASVPILPALTLHDSYKKGIHSISGSLVVPTPCTLVNARASVASSTASTSPARIHISVALTPDTGICLLQEATTTFSVVANAGAGAVLEASINDMPVKPIIR